MTASQPVISVVIPHLNQTESLRRCLQSLERQSYPRELFDVIVVDNGSKVLPSTIVGEYRNVSLEQEVRPGPGPARNRGVATSRGKILAFIDADCIAGEGWLASIAAALSDCTIEARGRRRCQDSCCRSEPTYAAGSLRKHLCLPPGRIHPQIWIFRYWKPSGET